MAHAAAWNGRIPAHDATTPAPYVWVEVPKAASTSIKMALAAAAHHPFDTDAGLHEWFGYTYAGNLAELHEWLAHRWADRFRFAVVRHPVDRFVSLYHEKIDPHGYGDASAWIMANADHWWWDDIHATPQSAIVGDPAWYDFVGRVEDMAAVRHALSAALRRPVRIPWANRTAGDPPRLTPDAVDALRRRYAADMAAFGYD